MKNKGLTSSQDIQIQGLLDRYLRLSISSNKSIASGQHLDDDSLTAFTEGNLSEREANPVIIHLVDCSFCRQMTTELVRLDLAFADETVQVAPVEAQPSKVSEVLNNLLSRIFGTGDDAVFAHQEKEENVETPKEKESVKK